MPSIDQALRPAHTTQDAKALRLYHERDIKLLYDCVDAEWHAADRPEQHHRFWKPYRTFGAVVA